MEWYHLGGVNHMTSKTQFQKECESVLMELVSSAGHSFSAKSLIIGNEENFIEGNVSGLKFWIYEDGAEIQTKDNDYRLEKEDYDSLEHLQEEFISIIRGHLKNNNREGILNKETLQCDRCRKRWQVGWVEVVEGKSIEHA